MKKITLLLLIIFSITSFSQVKHNVIKKYSSKEFDGICYDLFSFNNKIYVLANLSTDSINPWAGKNYEIIIDKLDGNLSYFNEYISSIEMTPNWKTRTAFYKNNDTLFSFCGYFESLSNPTINITKPDGWYEGYRSTFQAEHIFPTYDFQEVFFLSGESLYAGKKLILSKRIRDRKLYFKQVDSVVVNEIDIKLEDKGFQNFRYLSLKDGLIFSAARGNKGSYDPDSLYFYRYDSKLNKLWSFSMYIKDNKREVNSIFEREDGSFVVFANNYYMIIDKDGKTNGFENIVGGGGSGIVVKEYKNHYVQLYSIITGYNKEYQDYIRKIKILVLNKQTLATKYEKVMDTPSDVNFAYSTLDYDIEANGDIYTLVNTNDLKEFKIHKEFWKITGLDETIKALSVDEYTIPNQAQIQAKAIVTNGTPTQITISNVLGKTLTFTTLEEANNYLLEAKGLMLLKLDFTDKEPTYLKHYFE
jgi:hypothetical protein